MDSLLNIRRALDLDTAGTVFLALSIWLGLGAAVVLLGAIGALFQGHIVRAGLLLCASGGAAGAWFALRLLWELTRLGAQSADRQGVIWAELRDRAGSA